MANKLLQIVKEKSEEVMGEVGVNTSKVMNCLNFINYVSQNKAEQQVKVREFEIDGTLFSQAYLKDNQGCLVYCTVIGI